MADFFGNRPDFAALLQVGAFGSQTITPFDGTVTGDFYKIYFERQTTAVFTLGSRSRGAGNLSLLTFAAGTERVLDIKAIKLLTGMATLFAYSLNSVEFNLPHQTTTPTLNLANVGISLAHLQSWKGLPNLGVSVQEPALQLAQIVDTPSLTVGTQVGLGLVAQISTTPSLGLSN